MQTGMGDRRPSQGGISGQKIRPRILSMIWFAVGVSIFAGGVPARAQFPGSNVVTESTKATASEYVGSSACAVCHQEIYSNYSQTGM